VFGKQVRIVVAVVRASVDVLRVLGDELLYLKVIECGQLNGSRKRGVGFLGPRSGRATGPRAIDVIDVARPKSGRYECAPADSPTIWRLDVLVFVMAAALDDARIAVFAHLDPDDINAAGGAAA